MRHVVQTVTIAAGQSVSAPFNVESGRISALRLPSDWEGNANISFQGQDGQGGFFDVYDKHGLEYVLVGAVSRYIIVPPGDIDSLRALRIRSGTKDIPIVQIGQRVIEVHVVIEGSDHL